MLSGDNGLLKRTTDAKEITGKAEVVENAKLDVLAQIADNKGENISKEQLKRILNTYFIKDEVNALNIPDDTSTSTDILTSKEGNYKIKLSDIYSGKFATINRVYALGELVTVDDEEFYVITKNDNANSNTITILAKYNLNKAGTVQLANANHDETSCRFSSTSYWEDNVTNWMNLNDYPMPSTENTENNAIKKAQAYANLKEEGSLGRLLTYEEAESLKNENKTMENIIWGEYNVQSDGNYLFYSLGSIYETDPGSVCAVCGLRKDIEASPYIDVGWIGVRPVITLSKSSIQN